jgi:hypothetical protein
MARPSTQLFLRQGRKKEALENLIAECRLTRVLVEDHILISDLVRIAIAAIARTSVWEALQADGWSDADLAQLGHEWESINFATNMTRSLEGELIFGLGSYDSMRKSNSTAANSIYGLQNLLTDDSARPWWERTMRLLPGGEKCADFVKEQMYCRLWRLAWLDQDELQYLQFMEALLDIAHRAEAEKSLALIQPALDSLLEPATHTSFYDSLRHPQLSSYGALANSLKNRSMKAETERSLVLAAIALKRYSLRFGRPPPDLKSLVPDFLSSIPTDYMDGQPIKYHLEPDGKGFLYSVGEDCKDDGADMSLQPGKTSSRNWWLRKDVVWPQPALPDEIEKFRQEKAAGK